MKVKGRYFLGLKDLFNTISQESVLQYYTGIKQIPCVIRSPLRKDNHPSFSVFYTTMGIYYIDFATGDKGNLIDLLSKLLNTPVENLRDRILQDITYIEPLDNFVIKGSFKPHKGTRKNLEVTIRPWQDYDIAYWASYGITKEFLDFGRVYPISHQFLNGVRYGCEKYAYCYVEFKDSVCTLKVYQPYSKNYKWLNRHDASVWSLWSQAMASKDKSKLIITTSTKDALCLWCNTGIPSIALQSESVTPKPHIVELLLEKFNIIYYFGDNDYDKEINYGREYGKKLCELYPIKQIEIPSLYQVKDPSDCYKILGQKVFKQITNNLLK
jgi:hypothetical protein